MDKQIETLDKKPRGRKPQVKVDIKTTEQVKSILDNNVNTGVQVAAPVDTSKSVNDEEIIVNKSPSEILGLQKETRKNVTILKLKKIQKNTFRLGMEKSESQEQLMPGSAHTFQPFRIGDNFLTGLDNPKMLETKQRLAKILGKNLDSSSLFYEELSFRMMDRPDGQTVVMDDTELGAKHELMYYCMLASPLVANGLDEYTGGKKPHAEWYIENIEGEAENKAELINTEIEAYGLFTTMPLETKAGICKLFGIKAWGLSPTVITTTLWELIKNGDARTLNINAKEAVNKFIMYAKLPSGELRVKVLVEDAINFHVLRTNKQQDYVYGDEILGGSKDAVVDKLLNPRNSGIRQSLADKVSFKLNN